MKTYLFNSLNSTRFILKKAKNFVTYHKIKILLIIFLFTYGVILVIIIYLLFKNYKMGVLQFDQTKTPLLKQEIFFLIKNNNFNHLSQTFYQQSQIKQLFHLHGFDHYSTFLYASNNDMNILHRILESNSVINSNFRSMILQSMISNHLGELSDILMDNMKFTVKISIPFIIAVLGLIIINGYEINYISNIMT